MDYSIRKLKETDLESYLRIYNYFVVNSIATYSDKLADEKSFKIMRDMCVNDSFYMIDVDGESVGYGLLVKYRDSPNASHAANLCYFILPQYTHLGIGSELLSKLTEDAKNHGIETLLAHVSSLNDRSLKFHRKHGFKEVGTHQGVSKKHGKTFGVVWFQKFL